MSSTRNVMKRLSFWRSGPAVLGLVFAIAGVYVAWQGFWMLRELWGQVSALLPLKPLADDVGRQLAASLPLVSGLFIRIVSSICAVLVGVTWLVSGFVETAQAIGKTPAPADFHQRELVAEIVRTGELQYWRSAGLMIRWLGKTWSGVTRISPVSRKLVAGIGRSAVKTLLIGVALIVLWHGFHLAPTLLKRYLDVTVSLAIPSPLPLFVVLGLVLTVHVFVAISLLLARPPSPGRSAELVTVRGRGDVSLFFAMIEEGCKLLSGRDDPNRPPLRLEQADGPPLRGALIETSSAAIVTAGKLAGYVCTVLLFVLSTMGFTRLIHFTRPTAAMPYQEFLFTHLPDHCLELAFAVALIVAGMHVGEQARRLFAIRRNRSAVVFCHETLQSQQPESSGGPPFRKVPRPELPFMGWTVVHAADDRFAEWVKGTQRDRRFGVQVYWAEVFSESVDADGERFVTTMQQSAALDAAMARILAIPFLVGFERDDGAAATIKRGTQTGPEGPGVEKGSRSA